jgi:hypothetical protein
MHIHILIYIYILMVYVPHLAAIKVYVADVVKGHADSSKVVYICS